MSTPIDVKKLAFFYGWPSGVNGSTTVAEAVSHFSNYDAVVFGEGIEDPAHSDHTNTQNIINDAGMSSTNVYGYVNTTNSYTAVYTAIDRWITMGVVGIFLDRFGYDFSVSREKQNSLVEYIRYKGKHAFVNAWNPDDVFSSAVEATYNPQGLAASIDGNDIYLAESYQIINGAYQSETDWRTKSNKMATYKASHGTKMAATTTYDASAFDQDKADYSYYSAVLDGLDYWSWGEQFFSASSGQLPFRTRKPVYGDVLTGAIVQNGNVFERDTNVGIHIDTVNHTVDYLLD
jgi:hypothetical protein